MPKLLSLGYKLDYIHNIRRTILPLVFFIIVILLHISLTSGPANGFIFFSQVLTVSMEVIIIKSSWKQTNFHHPIIMTYIMEDLCSVWSLDFSRFFCSFAHSYHLCLGPQLKVIHVLSLLCLSALYPLCLIVVAYALIELHARNCQILVWLWEITMLYLCTLPAVMESQDISCRCFCSLHSSFLCQNSTNISTVNHIHIHL